MAGPMSEDEELEYLRLKKRKAQAQPQKREKQYTRIQSAAEGFKAGEGWGFRDEAEGTKALRMGENPGFAARAMQAVGESPLIPGARQGLGIADAIGGLLIENTGKYKGSKVQDRYETARDTQRKTEQVAREDNPLSFLGGELAGSTVSTGPAIMVGAPARGGALAARVASSAGRGAAGGAASGAVYGAGQSEGGLGDRLKGAGEGAATGAVAGALLNPAAQFVIGPVVGNIGYRAFAPAEVKALDMVLKRAERSGTDLQAVQNQFKQWKKTGEVPETLAEMMGPHERNLLTALVTANRETRETAANVLLERGKKEVDRLESAFERSFGAKAGDFRKAQAEAQRARSEDPEAFYRPAHFAPDGSLKPLKENQLSRLNNILVDESDADRIIAEALSDLNRAGHKGARDQLRVYGEALKKAKAGERLDMPPISVLAGDYIERAINESLRSVSRGGTQISGSARGWRNLRNSVRSVVDKGTGLKEARATAAERIRRAELLDEGRDIMKKGMDAEDVNAIMRGDPDLGIPQASEEARRAFGMGAARGISDELRNTPDFKGFADAARRVAKTPALREKLNAARPKTLTKTGKEHGGAKQTKLNRQLDEAIDRAAKRSEFASDQLAGSPTAFRKGAVDDALLDDKIAQYVGDAVGQTLARGPVAAATGAVARLGIGLGDRVARPRIYNANINREASKILLASGKEIPVQLKRLTERAAKRAGVPRPGFIPPDAFQRIKAALKGGGTPPAPGAPRPPLSGPPAGGGTAAGGFGFNPFGKKPPAESPLTRQNMTAVERSRAISEKGKQANDQYRAELAERMNAMPTRPANPDRGATEADWERALKEAESLLYNESRGSAVEPSRMRFPGKPNEPMQTFEEAMAIRLLVEKGIDPSNMVERALGNRPTYAQLASRTRSQGLPNAFRQDLGNAGAGAVGGGIMPIPSTGDPEQDMRNRLGMMAGGAAAGFGGRRAANVFGRQADDMAGFGAGGPRKPPPDSPEAIRAGVQKITAQLRTKGAAQSSPQQPDMKIGRGMASAMGLKTDKAAGAAVAKKMQQAGRSAEEIFNATGSLAVKVGGTPKVMRTPPGMSLDEANSEFWSAMRQPPRLRPKWVRDETFGLKDMSPDAVHKQPFAERSKMAEKAVTDPAFVDAFPTPFHVFEELDAIPIYRGKDGQLVMPTSRKEAEAADLVGILDAKKYKTFAAFENDLDDVLAKPYAQRPEWYKTFFTDPVTLASPATRAQRLADQIRKRPGAVNAAGYAVAGSAGIAAGAALGARNEKMPPPSVRVKLDEPPQREQRN